MSEKLDCIINLLTSISAEQTHIRENVKKVVDAIYGNGNVKGLKTEVEGLKTFRKSVLKFTKWVGTLISSVLGGVVLYLIIQSIIGGK